jgi:hypothetical protein
MAIYYLDAQDEITSAAARIRDSSDTRIALVLTGGSRVATSRINFRLLAGEAKRRNKQLAIVAADPSVQSVARTAELPVFATVGEYEKAEAILAGGGPELATTATLGELAMTLGTRGSSGRPAAGPAGPARKSRARIGGVPPSVLAGLTAVFVLVVGLGAFFFYPSATVAITVREETLGPMSLSVTVDPKVTALNEEAATVPGVTKAFPVDISGSFDATGQNVVETPATGTVTFDSINTVFAVPVIAGTQVSAAGGIAFTTTQTVSVPAAVVSGTRITHGTADAPVQAVQKGVDGNVAAGKIVKLPSDLVAAKVTVTNKSAMTGGTHTETPMIVQADIDKAESNLRSQLGSRLQEAISAPGAVPSGSNLFADSARLGDAVFSPDPQGLLNQTVASFELNASATGTAVVGDLSAVRTVAEKRIRGAVRSGYSLVAGSITTQLGTATTQGEAVVVPVTAEGLQTPIVDAGRLRAAVLGKTVDEARTYLAQFGRVDISVDPGWASTMPSWDFRIDVRLSAASAQPSAIPSETVPPTPSVVPTPSPTAVVSASPSAGSPPPSISPSPTPDVTSPGPSAS